MKEEFNSKKFADLLIILADEDAWKQPDNRAIYRATAVSSRQGDREFDEARKKAKKDAKNMYNLMQSNRDNIYAFAEFVNVGGKLRAKDRALVYEGLAKLAKQIADEGIEVNH